MTRYVLRSRRAAGRLACLLAAAILLSCLPAFAAQDVTVRVARACTRDTYNLRIAPTTDNEPVGRLLQGQSVYVLGEEDGWYRILHGTGSVYVIKDAAEIIREYTLRAGTNDFAADNVMFSTVIQRSDPIEGRGEYIFASSVLRVVAVITDDTTGEDIYTSEITSFEGDGTIVPASYIANSLSYGPGERTHLRLTLMADTEKGTVRLYDERLYIAEDAYSESEHATDRCTITATGDGDVTYLTDRYYMNEWLCGKSGGDVDIALPFDNGGYIVINWSEASDDFKLDCLNGKDKVLRSYLPDRTNQIYRGTYEIPDGTKRLHIRVNGAGGIAELRVYSAEQTEHQDFSPLTENVDLMVFSAHLDDELLWFGGAIPYYAGIGKKVGMVYMTRTGWVRRNESLNAMWECGVRSHPVYLNLKDERIDSYEDTVSHWGHDEALGMVVETIRRYKPQVIVTHDLGGEYGHNQHKLTANLLTEAVKLTDDRSAYPASAKKYGTWQVKKLYIHYSDENAIYMDWNRELPGEGGLTAMDRAKIAYCKYVSQMPYYTMWDGLKYDNTKFGLYYTTVGTDVEKNDLFENIGG